MRHEFATAARDAHAQKIDFNEFARRTGARWRWWANRLQKNYKLPNWFTRDDVEQELLIEAWRMVAKFDPTRGVEAAKFIEWRAVKNTQKVVQKARGVEQHRRKGQPRLPTIPMSNPYDPEKDFHPTVDPTQHDDVERAWKFSVLADICETTRELSVVRALEKERSYEGAAAGLYGDPQIRKQLALRSERDAGALIRAVVDGLILKFGNEEALS